MSIRDENDEYKTVYGIQGTEIVTCEARPVEGGWLVRDRCFRQFVEKDKLSETREGAEARLRSLPPV